MFRVRFASLFLPECHNPGPKKRVAHRTGNVSSSSLRRSRTGRLPALRAEIRDALAQTGGRRLKRSRASEKTIPTAIPPPSVCASPPARRRGWADPLADHRHRRGGTSPNQGKDFPIKTALLAYPAIRYDFYSMIFLAAEHFLHTSKIFFKPERVTSNSQDGP